MKKQFIAQLTLVATLLSVLLFSCKKDEVQPDPVKLEVKKLTLEFKAEDVAQKIEVSSNYKWEAKSDADWCKVTVEEKALTVAVDAYSDVEVDRYASITVKSANGNDVKTVTIDVTQTKKEPVILALNPGKVILECEGLVPSTVELVSNSGLFSFSWDGEKPEWMNDPTVENGVMTLTAQDNPTKEKRTATLLVTAGKDGDQATEKLEIEQSPNGPYVKIHPSNRVELDYLGTPVTIDVYWNTEYLYIDELLKGAWGAPIYQIEEITEQPTTLKAELLKRRKRSFKIWIDMNPMTEERTQRAFLSAVADKGKPNEVRATTEVKVVQLAAPVASFSIARKDILFGSKGGQKTIAVNASIPNWEATCDAAWVKLERSGNDLIIKTDPNTDPANQTAVINLSCGLGANVGRERLDVVIAGVDSKIALSKSPIILDAEGTEQVVDVLTEAKDWFVEGAPEWLTVKEDVAKGSLSLKATKADAPREVNLKIVGTIGGKKAEHSFLVKQAKQYKLGDIYSIDGKEVGIVFYVYNGGTNGYVFSFEDNKLLEQNYEASKMPCWSIGMYADPRDEHADEIMKKMKPCCLDPNDGRNNLEAVKKRSEADLRGMTWQERYPALAWVDNFDQEKGNQGWYIPAMNELKHLVLYVNGIYEGSGIILPQDKNSEDPENQKKRMEAMDKLNAIIKEHGGNPFYKDTGMDGVYFDAPTKMISSTELDAQQSGIGAVGVYLLKTIYPWWDQAQHASAITEEEISDINLATRCSIRPILRF